MQAIIPLAQVALIWYISFPLVIARYLVTPHAQVHSRKSTIFGRQRLRQYCFLIAFFGLPELQEGRAANILAKYHANGGDERDPLVVFEIAQIRHAIRMEEELNASTSFRSLFSTPGNRKRMRLIIAIGLFSQWRYIFVHCVQSLPLLTIVSCLVEMDWCHITSTSCWRVSA